MGKAGEEAAGIKKNNENIVINGNNRKPDILSETEIGDVKNVGYQHLSTQLRDYLDYAKATNKKMVLYVRSSTKLSKQLQELIDSGEIELRLCD